MASSEEFSSLREEALRRMRQMHSASHSSRPPAEASPPQEVYSPPISPPPPPPEVHKDPGRSKASPFSEFLGSLAGIGGQRESRSLFDELNIDEEKAIIGVLIYVLYKNGADIKLMLALGYLLI